VEHARSGGDEGTGGAQGRHRGQDRLRRALVLEDWSQPGQEARRGPQAQAAPYGPGGRHRGCAAARGSQRQGGQAKGLRGQGGGSERGLKPPLCICSKKNENGRLRPIFHCSYDCVLSSFATMAANMLFF